MCKRVTKPFYGWVPHYFKTVLGGYISHTKKHSGYFLPFFVICLMLGNMGFNIYHAYVYYEGEFFYLSDTDSTVSFFLIIFTGLGMGSLIPGFWTIGNYLLNVEENAKIIKPEEEDMDRLRAVTPTKNVVSTSTSTSSTNNMSNVADILVTVFVLIFEAICLGLISSVHIHILHYEIIDCLISTSYTILASLILGGFLLPLAIQYLTITNMHATVVKRTFSFCIKLVAVMLTVCVLAIGGYSVWLGSFATYKLISATQFETQECGVRNKIQFESNIPPRLSITIPDFDEEIATKLIHLNLLIQTEDRMHKHFPIRCDQLNPSIFPYLKNCNNLFISAMYNSTIKTVLYKVKIENKNLSLEAINEQWYNDTVIQYSCGSCLMRQALREGQLLSNRTIPKTILEPCVKAYPTWLMYILYGYTGVLFIAFITTLVTGGSDMRSYLNKKKLKRRVVPKVRIVVDEHGNRKVLKKKKTKVMKVGRRR